MLYFQAHIWVVCVEARKLSLFCSWDWLHSYSSESVMRAFMCSNVCSVEVCAKKMLTFGSSCGGQGCLPQLLGVCDSPFYVPWRGLSAPCSPLLAMNFPKVSLLWYSFDRSRPNPWVGPPPRGHCPLLCSCCDRICQSLSLFPCLGAAQGQVPLVGRIWPAHRGCVWW